MEVRLNHPKKIKHLFGKLNIKANLTFKSLFKLAISKKVLLHYLDDIDSKRTILLDYRATNDRALLAAIAFNNLNLGPKQVIQLFGFKKALEIINPRELRSMFKVSGSRSWYRLIADVNKVKLPMTKSPFNVIRECITKFKPLKLSKIK